MKKPLFVPYLPNIEWFHSYLCQDSPTLLCTENFPKSTYRNRCEIYGANGKNMLSIPLEGGRDHHQKYSETRISYSSNWQNVHWRSLVSAYKSTPYFDFYAERFIPFFTDRHELVLSYNLELIQLILQILKIESEVKLNEAPVLSEHINLSEVLEKNGSSFRCERYYQIFENRHGFINNLSIVDLLFHEGPNSIAYLRRQKKAL